ncbi:Dihydroflavonol-4-reductase [Dichanthelium oligosanthes]|uniref:Dihydroflavonol-4-reductase n=1 Tax=Dichanthelium oligosanthes TaxID=888268 RepID=A0A1E5VY40_9POAL|nr:Dihydroflavonol-4-reductase [Dichanthelium oligosanthes]
MGSVGGGSPEEQQAGGSDPPVVCVTGSTGYVGSWLVRTLLRRGYRVHATARDTGTARAWLIAAISTCLPGVELTMAEVPCRPLFVSSGKAWQVFAAVEGGDRLRVFRADMGEDGSFDAAVTGCVAIFHVAASMELQVAPGHDNVGEFMRFLDLTSTLALTRSHLCYPWLTDVEEERVRSDVLEPATRGTINVLQSCVRAGTVRRVIFTSSVSTLTAADVEGRRKAVVDESCLRDLDDVWRTKPVGWIYILSKRLTEEAAFRFARENGLHLVSVILPTVAGPFLTPSVPTSIQLLLSPITGAPTLYSLLASVHSRFGCLPLAHVQDACDAHVFLAESPRAEGRYLCAAGGHPMAQVARLLASRYPPFKPAERHVREPSPPRSLDFFRLSRDFDASCSSTVSSKRLLDLGFRFEYGVGDIVTDSVGQCLDHGFLEHPES